MSTPVIELTAVVEGRSNGPAVLFGARPMSGDHVTVTYTEGVTFAGVYIRREDRNHWGTGAARDAFSHAPDNTCDVVVPFALYVSQP